MTQFFLNVLKKFNVDKGQPHNQHNKYKALWALSVKKMDVKILGHIEFMYQSYQVKSGRYVG